MTGRFLAVRVGTFSADATAEVDGVAFVPVALFLWEDRATVHFVAVGEQPEGHARAVERWARSGSGGPPPEHPCSAAFSQLTVSLLLADGAEATAVGSSVGGSDSEWEAAVRFRLPPGGPSGLFVVRTDWPGASPVDVGFAAS